MNTAVYIRVSTFGQNEASQRSEIGKWLQGNNINDADWYFDTETGDHLNRPEFNRLQMNIFAGMHKQVIVYKLDRLSRSIIDGLNVLGDWLKKGVRVVSVTQQLDFSGPLGKMLASIFFALGEMEQETRRERQAAGIECAKLAGKYKGRKPGATKSRPAEAVYLHGKGLTHQQIANALKVTRQTVINYLNSRKLKDDKKGQNQHPAGSV